MTTFWQEIDRLRKDYPTFVIVPIRVSDGQRVAAYCSDAAAPDGLYAVIGTPNEVEAELAKAFAGPEEVKLISQLILWPCRKKTLNGPLPARAITGLKLKNH
jgi:hypothetical protein